MKRDKR